MDTTRGRSNRRNTAPSQRRKRTSLSGWTKEDELILFGGQHGHRHGPMNYDYDFPIEKWSEKRIAAEKRQNENASSFNTKASSKCKHTTQPSKDPEKPNPLLTLCSLINHCESIPDFEQFKGHSLIAALTSRSTRSGLTQLGTVRKEEDDAKAGETAHLVATDAADDESQSQTDHKASSSRLRRQMSSADPEETTPRNAAHPRASSSESLRYEHSSESLGGTPSPYENKNSDSILGLSTSSSTMSHESGSTFTSKQQKLPLPVRFYYTRLNAAVQGRLDQLNQNGAIASLVWKSPVHPPLPLLLSPGNSHHHSTGLVQSSPRYIQLSSTGVSSYSMAKAPNVYQTTDALSSGPLSKPMTKQSVLAALARVRFQTEGPNDASAILLPPALPLNRQATRKLCEEQQREASAELEARGQTCVMHESSSVNVDAVSKAQLFHIGDLLQTMDSNRKRETSVVPRYLGSADVSL